MNQQYYAQQNFQVAPQLDYQSMQNLTREQQELLALQHAQQ